MFIAALALPATLAAQVSPAPSFDDPRLQTVAYDSARPVRVIAFVDVPLTIMLLSGERITAARLSEQAAFEIRIGTRGDSLHITARGPEATAGLTVDTSLRRYEFELAVGNGLGAAYLVRFVASAHGASPFAPRPPTPLPLVPPPTASASPSVKRTEYRLSGERALRPVRIGDDGERTYIEWEQHQSLPAVFGIGASGEEEVVDGYMRQDLFVIDRVYADLVFRIDRKSAKARRLAPVGSSG